MASHFKQSYTEDIDRQVEASPMAEESITKLRAGQGARKFAARPRAQKERSGASKGVLIGVAIAAVAVIVVGALLVRAIFSGERRAVEDLAPDAIPKEQSADVAVDPSTGAVESGEVTWDGESFSVVPLEGTYAVVATDEAGNQRSLFVLRGTPATLLLYNGVLLVPENLADGGWDVIAFVLGAESQASPVVGADGAAVTGDGEVAEARLDGGELVVSDTMGATTRIAL